jgi:PAS domain S-box-containing protein
MSAVGEVDGRAAPLVLVIEDEPATRELCLTTLDGAGYRVAAVGDARRALAFCETERPDLVLQSLRLPDAAGLELVKRLRELLEGADCPIVALASLSSTLERATQDELFSDFLVKPFGAERLLELVTAYAPTRGAGAPPARGDDRRVLLVDDDRFHLQVLRLHFRRAGFRVHVADDGEEALEVMLADPPDVVVSDLLMPRMDGFRLARAMRETPILKTMPLILVSPEAPGDDDRQMAASAGADAIVARVANGKPAIRAVLKLLDSEPTGADSTSFEAMTLDDDDDEPGIDTTHHRARMVRSLERQAHLTGELSRVANLNLALLSVLAGVADSLGRALDVETALEEVLARCVDVQLFTHGAAWLLEDHGELRLVRQVGFEDPRGELGELFGYAALLHRALDDLEVLCLPAEDQKQAERLLQRAGSQSLLVVPLGSGGIRLGVLVLASNNDDLRKRGFAFARAIQGQLSQSLLLVERTRELARVHADTRLILASLHEAVYRVDEQGLITFANEAVTRMTGWAPEELVGRSAHALLHAEPVDPAGCPLCRPPAQQSPIVDTRVRTRGGSELAIRQATRPIVSTGPDLGCVVTFRDVTRQRELEEQLRHAQKMEAFGQLAGGVAHTFNNLLTPILGNVSLVREKLIDAGAGTLADPLADAERAGRRAAELVSQMLAFGRRSELFLQPTDLASIVGDVCRFLRRSLDRTIQLDWEIEKTLAAVRGDAPLIHQVLLNLGLNARDAIRARREGGTESDERIVVRAYNLSLDAGSAALHRNGREGVWSVVSVTDNGVGMDPDTAGRMFEPFFSTKQLREGTTGLGLAVVHGILEQHGGWVEFESELGRGSTFTCCFPATDEEVERLTRSEVPAMPMGSGTVLLVDDDTLVRKLGRRLLTAGGYQVIEAENGLEALAEYRERREEIDLILLDLSMPVMSGEETLEEFLDLDPDIRVILWSGYSRGEAAESVEALGAKAFLAKPFDARRLLTLVARVMAEE